MKKHYLASTLALAALSLASCTINEIGVVDKSPAEPQGIYMTFDASLAENNETKTNLVNEDGVYKFPWTPGDAISLFYGSGSNGGSKFTSNATAQTSSTKFSGVINVITGGDEDSTDETSFWAIYPYNVNNSCDGESLTFTLPSVQTAVAEGIAPNTCPTIAKASGLHLSFYQTCGFFRFTVSEEGIKQVVFTTADYTDIAGTMKCSFGEDGKPVLESVTSGSDRITVNAPNNGTFATGTNYYVIMAPVTMNGMYVTYVKDDKQATYKISSQVPIKRKVGNWLENRDSGLSWDLRDHCLKFSVESGTNTLYLDCVGENHPYLEWSTDKIVWKEWNYTSGGILFTASKPLYIRGGGNNGSNGFSQSETVYSTFRLDSPASVEGNIMSLLSSTVNKTVLRDIQNSSNPINLQWCYYRLFQNAPIVTAPELPATVLSNHCYEYMFDGCTSLTKAPELPATWLAESCYKHMFSGCTSLNKAPALPEETLETSCYAYMFAGCTSLTDSPVLPAACLKTDCYDGMFSGCSNLNRVEAYFTDWDGSVNPTIKWSIHTTGWLENVAETGTFIRSVDAAWQRVNGINGIPSGWDVRGNAESFTLDSDHIWLMVGEEHQFTATLEPASSVAQTVTWTDDNNDYLGSHVTSNGKFQATRPGHFIVTATCMGISASCIVDVYPTEVRMYAGGPLWSTRNIGADKPFEEGSFCAWNSCIDRIYRDGNWYSRLAYAFGDESPYPFTLNEYTQNGDYLTDLMATTRTGTNPITYFTGDDRYKFPTGTQFMLLFENTTQTWVNDYDGSGVPGFVFRGKGDYSNNVLFFPAAGYGENNEYSGHGHLAYCWTPEVEDYTETWYNRTTYPYAFAFAIIRSGGAAVDAWLSPILKCEGAPYRAIRWE